MNDSDLLHDFHFILLKQKCISMIKLKQALTLTPNMTP